MANLSAVVRQGIEAEIFHIQREVQSLLPRASGTVRVAIFQILGAANLIASGSKVEVFDLESMKRFIAPEVNARHPGANDKKTIAVILDGIADRMIDIVRASKIGRDDLVQDLLASDPIKQIVTRELGDGRELCYGIASMHENWSAIQRVGQMGLPVMVNGESGTGKELIARAVAKAARPDQPFVAVNTAGLTGDLSSALLFGHKKGSFTNADRDTKGFFGAAENGVLFLDEVGDMDAKVQATMLRVLQERRYQRVGSTEEIDVKAHIIFATAKNIDEERDSGRMRTDMHARLASAFPINLKPLRERADKPVLIAHFVRKLQPNTELTDGAMDLLMTYPFPENVRELEAVLRSAQVWALVENDKEPCITAEHLIKCSRGMRQMREVSGYRVNALPVNGNGKK